MIKVLFAAAEAVPFVKTGGLADVVGTLPKELLRQGVDVRVILPKCMAIPLHFQQQMSWKRSISVPVGWRSQFCGLEEAVVDGVHFYFLDNEYYFKRPGLYGYGDDGERFAFYCRAVLEALPHLSFVPDILHCHDWHTGMVSVLLAAHYRHSLIYRHMKTVFTIHNLAYQGIFPKECLSDLLGLGWEYFHPDALEFNDCINFMKGGLVFSDRITTVSKTYAEEIKTPHYGERLEGTLLQRQDRLTGIVNGIDYELYNPASGQDIFSRYTVGEWDKKAENKLQLQKVLNLPVRKEVPLIALVSRLVQPKGLDLISRVFDEILEMDVQFVVLGTGEKRYEQMFREAACRYPDKVSANIFFDDTLSRLVYAASDLFLMPSLFEPCGIGQLIALRYGSLPVVRETGGLRDTVRPYNQYTGEGTGFSFGNFNAHDMLYTLQRAVGLYYDHPDTWHALMKQAMESDYSWKGSAQQYKRLYKQLK